MASEELGAGLGTGWPAFLDTIQAYQNLPVIEPDGPTRFDAEFANDAYIAILALQTELGTLPSGASATVKDRFDALDALVVPGAAKVWVAWESEGTHSILGSHNMTSVTDGGAAGGTDHVYNVPFSSANYAISGAAQENGSLGTSNATVAAGSVTTLTRDLGNTPVDLPYVSMSIHGDQ